MMGSRGSVIVVGAGIAGLSAAWALERRGFAVSVFEQGPIPNPRASSYDEHRITRYAYGPAEGYAHMMPAAFAMYERMFRDIGATHLAMTGVVYFMREETGWYEPVTRNLREMGKAIRDVPMAEIAARFPMIRRDGVTAAVETEGGMLFPIRILTDLAVALGERGVALHAETRVTAVDPEAGLVVADGREHRADHVIVAAGAWVDRLTDRVSSEVVPSRQAVIYLAAPPRLAAAWRAAPALADLGAHSLTYALPPRFGTRLKVGDHMFTRAGDPDDDRVATAEDLRRLLGAADGFLEDFEQYRVLERRACYYTVTRDDSEQFQVKPWGAKAWVVSACSGHGFKLGALIADGVAAAIAGEAAPEDVTRWAAGQFSPEESRAFCAETAGA